MQRPDPPAASVYESVDHLTERVAQVSRTDAYSRPRWTLADVQAVERMVQQANGCPICRQEIERERSDADA